MHNIYQPGNGEYVSSANSCSQNHSWKIQLILQSQIAFIALTSTLSTHSNAVAGDKAGLEK